MQNVSILRKAIAVSITLSSFNLGDGPQLLRVRDIDFFAQNDTIWILKFRGTSRKGNRNNTAMCFVCIFSCQHQSALWDFGDQQVSLCRSPMPYFGVLFGREGILAFPVTDRPPCLRKHNYTSDWAPYCSKMSPCGPSNGSATSAEAWWKGS